MKLSTFIKKYTMTLALFVVFVFFSILTGGRMLLAQNISNLLLQNAYVLVMACGMLLCILTGGNVDLSVGATLCLSAATAGQVIAHGGGTLTAIIVALAIGLVIGICQGFLIGHVHIPPFICTLAGMFLYRGIARAVLDSQTVSIQDETYLNLFTSYINIPGLDARRNCVSAIIAGVIIAVLVAFIFIYNRRKNKANDPNSRAWLVKLVIIDSLILFYSYKLSQYRGIPVMLLWILGVVLIFGFMTQYTAFGRHFYAVGGNEKAAKLSGIDPRRVYFWAYLLMSVLAAFAGLLVSARIGAIDGNMGNSYEMDAIASCFIGGASAYGGSGNIGGVMIGAILLGVINQGMSIFGLSDQWQYVVKGAVLLTAVVFDVVSNHKTGKS